MIIAISLTVLISFTLGYILGWGGGHDRGRQETLEELGYKRQSWAERRAGMEPHKKYAKKRGYEQR